MLSAILLHHTNHEMSEDGFVCVCVCAHAWGLHVYEFRASANINDWWTTNIYFLRHSQYTSIWIFCLWTKFASSLPFVCACILITVTIIQSVFKTLHLCRIVVRLREMKFCAPHSNLKAKTKTKTNMRPDFRHAFIANENTIEQCLLVMLAFLVLRCNILQFAVKCRILNDQKQTCFRNADG